MKEKVVCDKVVELSIRIPELEAACGTETKVPWSEEDKATLAEYWPRGVPTAVLVRYFGRSKASIHSQVQLMGLRREPKKHKSPPPER